MVYLDWAASAPPRESARQTDDDSEYFANPSAVHQAGLAARSRLNELRTQFARSLGCTPHQIFFTSGGTEANNLVITSILNYLNPNRGTTVKVICSGTEHASVFYPVKKLADFGVKTALLNSGASGHLDLESLEKELTVDTKLVALMAVNNETGAVQPAEEAGHLTQDYARRQGRKILFLTDCVQALGKIQLSLAKPPWQAATFSAHKLGGPKGVGALYLQQREILTPLYCGGGQEEGIRAGTENLSGIGAFCRVVTEALENLDSNFQQASRLMALLIGKLRQINGCLLIPTDRTAEDITKFSPYIVKVAFPPIPGEVLVRFLSTKGYYLATGAACSSRLKQQNRVMQFMGVDPQTAASSLRISIGPATTEQEVLGLVQALHETLTALKPLY